MYFLRALKLVCTFHCKGNMKHEAGSIYLVYNSLVRRKYSVYNTGSES